MSTTTFIKGKLKLKGSSSSSGVGKKRKQEEINESNAITSSRASTAIKKSQEQQHRDIKEGKIIAHLTEAEKRHRQRKLDALEREAKKLIQLTYRDRVEKFNNKLASMSEHNDIPRISAAGNG